MRYSLLPSAQKTPHYAALLVVLLILILVAPQVMPDRGGHWVEFFFDLVLVAGAYSVAWQSRHRWPFVALTVVTLVMRWTDRFSHAMDFSFASSVIAVLWIVYAVSLIVAALFRARQVTTNAIFGAIVSYLLAAIAFALVYQLIEQVQPGSFSGLPDTTSRQEQGDALLYFSLVCLTTMGYGDIVPVSSLTRPLSVLEGVFGVLYLAVMIARLVGLHIVSTREDESGQDDSPDSP